MSLTVEQLAAGIHVAYTQLNQGRWNDARVLIEGLLAIDPDNAYLHLLLASTFSHQGQLDDAIVEYSRVIELAPADLSALMNRGEIYLKQGKLVEAAADLKSVIVKDAGQKDPVALRAAFLLEMTSGALKLVEHKGFASVQEAHQQIKQQLKRS